MPVDMKQDPLIAFAQHAGWRAKWGDKDKFSENTEFLLHAKPRTISPAGVLALANLTAILGTPTFFRDCGAHFPCDCCEWFVMLDFNEKGEPLVKSSKMADELAPSGREMHRRMVEFCEDYGISFVEDIY